MVNETLMSCPFCGSTDVSFEDVGVDGEFQDYAISCDACRAFFTQSTDGEIRSKKDVMEAWNRRAVEITLPKNLGSVKLTLIPKMSNQEWIQTADTSSLAGFLQKISCKHCSSQGKCNSGQYMDCFDSAYKWLKGEYKE